MRGYNTVLDWRSCHGAGVVQTTRQLYAYLRCSRHPPVSLGIPFSFVSLTPATDQTLATRWSTNDFFCVCGLFVLDDAVYLLTRSNSSCLLHRGAKSNRRSASCGCCLSHTAPHTWLQLRQRLIASAPLGGADRVVNSPHFYPASLKSLGRFYFWCVFFFFFFHNGRR